VYRVWCPKQKTEARQRKQVLRTYQERASLRGVERIFGVDRHSVLRWIAAHVEQLPSLAESLLPKVPGDVLELDELWAFV
jgi:hypothetical protein